MPQLDDIYDKFFVKNSNRLPNPGFTIVELLVVIVVIGILAAITIVSYTGISQKAVVASLQSDLTNASTQLKMFYVDNGNYPNTIDCGTADSNTNKCLKVSSGNSYTHYQANNTTNPQTFSLIAVNSNGSSYRISDDSKPTVISDTRTSCLAILNAGEASSSGTYWIKPSGTVIPVYCDMITSGGGWTKIYEGLATSATSVSRTLGDIVEISDDITFNEMKIQAKNWNLSRTGTTSETAKLLHTFSWYFEWLYSQPDISNPDIKFHDLDGNQDVQFTVLGQILRGYGNNWRQLISGEFNLTYHDSFMYLGDVPGSIHKEDWGYGDYNTHMNDESPTEGGLGLTPRKFQEIYVWVR